MFLFFVFQESTSAKAKRNNGTTKKFLLDADRLFSTISDVFCGGIGTEIKQVVLMLGATIVTPKELYRFTLNNHSTCVTENKDTVSLSSCMRNIFKMLMSPAFSGRMASTRLPVNNIFVMILCPRISDTTLIDTGQLLPKLKFRPKTLGLDCDMQLSCVTSKIVIYEDCPDVKSSSACSDDTKPLVLSTDENATDCIWYQVIPRIKGIR